MRVSEDGDRSFTYQELHDADVITSRRGSVTPLGSCCPACHRWDVGREHLAGVVIHRLPTVPG